MKLYFGCFPSEIRPDFVSEASLELMSDYCDNKWISIGCQSGSEKILKETCRGHSVTDVLVAVDIAKRNGFRPVVDFILGLPGEEKEDEEKTKGVMKEIASMGGVVHVNNFSPLPGTCYENKKIGRVSNEMLKFLKKLKKRKALVP